MNLAQSRALCYEQSAPYGAAWGPGVSYDDEMFWGKDPLRQALAARLADPAMWATETTMQPKTARPNVTVDLERRQIRFAFTDDAAKRDLLTAYLTPEHARAVIEQLERGLRALEAVDNPPPVRRVK